MQKKEANVKKGNFSVPGISVSHRIDTTTVGLNVRHIHDLYEILYVVSGNGRYLVEGAEFELKPRTLLLIKPFKYHCV